MKQLKKSSTRVVSHSKILRKMMIRLREQVVDVLHRPPIQLMTIVVTEGDTEVAHARDPEEADREVADVTEGRSVEVGREAPTEKMAKSIQAIILKATTKSQKLYKKSLSGNEKRREMNTKVD